MVNFKKMDDKDFIFINKPMTPTEEKAFSDFLKLKKKVKPVSKATLNKKIKHKEKAHHA